MATVLAQDELQRWTNLSKARERGAIFTPPYLAEWVAELLKENCSLDPSTIADFGCGSGNLLSAAAKRFPSASLIGLEIDGPSVITARAILGPQARVVEDDVLNPTGTPFGSLAENWINKLGERPDGVIMNPPWGADHSLDRVAALASGLNLAWGQFDTYDLFCELALQVIRPGGGYVFIIPDSIFLPEHERLRKLLVEQTTITMLARLGEGIFESVYRGCVVVAGRAVIPLAGHEVECLRVTKAHRRSLRLGFTLQDVRHEASHWVPQSRFRQDVRCRFDVDVTSKDEIIARVLNAGGNWTQPLNSRRGVELSKSGKVLICSSCGAARPKPKASSAACMHCGAALAGETHVIIAERPSVDGNWRPFMAGEDVCRYSASYRRWIRTDLSGINYKRPNSKGVPRILVRKTGIGLNATLESSNSFTNQVVFEYTLGSEAGFDFSYLHYVLGVLCSRTLFAVHLKRGGDLEWRSHPYMTQKTLAELPIPLPQPGTKQWTQAKAIAEAVANHLDGNDSDLLIEQLVAGLYGLTDQDMLWVANFLSGAANLEAIRNLRLDESKPLQPIIVS